MVAKARRRSPEGTGLARTAPTMAAAAFESTLRSEAIQACYVGDRGHEQDIRAAGQGSAR